MLCLAYRCGVSGSLIRYWLIADGRPDGTLFETGTATRLDAVLQRRCSRTVKLDKLRSACSVEPTRDRKLDQIVPNDDRCSRAVEGKGQGSDKLGEHHGEPEAISWAAHSSLPSHLSSLKLFIPGIRYF